MEFEIQINNPEFWFAKSDQMFEASKILFAELKKRTRIREVSDNDRKVGAHNGSLFFLGIAIENAIKGFIAHKGKMKIRNNKLIASESFKGAKPHDLYELADKLSIEINSQEIELLKRLSVYTIWAGKYGTPINKNDFITSIGQHYQTESDYKIAADMIKRLRLNSGFNEESGWPEL